MEADPDIHMLVMKIHTMKSNKDASKNTQQRICGQSYSVASHLEKWLKETLVMFMSKAKEQQASDNGKILPNLLMFAVISKMSDYWKANESKKHTVAIKNDCVPWQWRNY